MARLATLARNELNCCMEACDGRTIALRMLCATPILTFAVELGAKMGVSSDAHVPLASCSRRRTTLVMIVEAVTTALPMCT